MKNIKYIVLSLVLASCGASSTKKGVIPPLFEVLTQQSDGGANIQFYEILTEPNEIKMLQNDEFLKKKISTLDVQKSNFLILNMGEKPTGGYSIGVESVEQVADSIHVRVKEVKPETGAMVTQSITYPYCVVKINSKKGIRIK
ncbi:protease complex subunit PrcB family protein [Flavobacterium sp. NG2]|uniref:protease complex subunit PrcB family protein n=1 Tax=Flavobacterium sp. NG2 TaxID=3097547 RepID=UPI002A830F9A|nr:protease complex subunit PrcB family protein [Flavobacterium sp. NG2]WPR70800.1 protease complex subunit PrcB family protein [Flavobacterium sp. NG2]